jgi:hypothetical protein
MAGFSIATMVMADKEAILSTSPPLSPSPFLERGKKIKKRG